jgi:hypothetical protein
VPEKPCRRCAVRAPILGSKEGREESSEGGEEEQECRHYGQTINTGPIGGLTSSRQPPQRTP